MSSATDPAGRSSAEIEREVEATRSGLSNTLEELRDRASPGQLFEQALDYARTSGGAELVRNLGQSVRDNPLPLVLIGAGIGWLMFTGSNGNRAASAQAAPGQSPLGHSPSVTPRSSTRIRVYSGTDQSQTMGESGNASLTERASGATSAVAGRVGDAASDLRDSVAGAASQFADRASSTYRSATDAAGSVTDSVRGAVASTAEQMVGAGQDVRERFEDFGANSRQGISWLMREQPLVLGAIGVALGAAIGALIPGTEAEDRLMGETRDRVADQAHAAAQKGYEQVKDTAGEHLQHATAAASQAAGQAKEKLSGSSTGQVGNVVTDAAQQARHAAHDVAHDVAEKARSALAPGKTNSPNTMSESDEPRRA
jgi:hypothetical protein